MLIEYAYFCNECCCILEMPCFVDGKCPECKSESKEILYLKKKDDKVNNDILNELEDNRHKIIPEYKVKYCSECPHCEDNYYEYNGVDHGYYCKLSGKKIMSDERWEKIQIKHEGMPIPKWCELKSTK